MRPALLFYSIPYTVLDFGPINFYFFGNYPNLHLWNDSSCNQQNFKLTCTSQTISTTNSAFSVFPERCIKDILILLDTSYSIGPYMFNGNFIPFLLGLVEHPRLKVSSDGSHISIITFSSSSKTGVRLSFNQADNKAEIRKIIQNFNYSEIAGDRTRTDLALKLANKVCPGSIYT